MIIGPWRHVSVSMHHPSIPTSSASAQEGAGARRQPATARAPGTLPVPTPRSAPPTRRGSPRTPRPSPRPTSASPRRSATRSAPAGPSAAPPRLIAGITGGWAARVRVIPGLQLSRHGHPHGSAEAVAGDCADLSTKNSVPLLALAPGWMARAWTWRAGDPMPPELEAEIADLEILHIGDGWVRAMARLSGETAGHDILELHRKAVRLLGETPAPPDVLDGIPCRNCEAGSSLAVLEQPPPDPETPAPPWARCLECRDEMTRKEYEKWTDQYAGWTHGSGILTCRRCDLGLCAEPDYRCSWKSCTCRAPGHRAA